MKPHDWLSACFTATMNNLTLPVSVLAAGISLRTNAQHLSGGARPHPQDRLLLGLPGGCLAGWPSWDHQR